MRIPSPLFSAAALAALAAMPFTASTAQAQTESSGIWHGAGTVVPVDAAREPVYGPPSSDFSIIVWIDPECPYCKVLGKTPEMVVDGSGGRVNLAVRMLPLPMHGRAAFMAAATAICIGQQGRAAGYFRFMNRYLELTGTNGAGLTEVPGSNLNALAREAGITDTAKLDSCVRAPETVRLLGSEFEAANAAGVTGTPAIAVRDNRNATVVMTEGAIGADDISRIIRALGASAAK